MAPILALLAACNVRPSWGWASSAAAARPAAWWQRGPPQPRRRWRSPRQPEAAPRGAPGQAWWMLTAASVAAVGLRSLAAWCSSEVRARFRCRVFASVEVSETEDPRLFKALVRWLERRRVLASSGSFRAVAAEPRASGKPNGPRAPASFRPRDDVCLLPLFGELESARSPSAARRSGSRSRAAAASAARTRRTCARSSATCGRRPRAARRARPRGAASRPRRCASPRSAARRRRTSSRGSAARRSGRPRTRTGATSSTTSGRARPGPSRRCRGSGPRRRSCSGRASRRRSSATSGASSTTSPWSASRGRDDVRERSGGKTTRSRHRRRSWYNERCVPHRRGYCLHGPPGSGKSALVHAVASRAGQESQIPNFKGS